MSSNYINKVNKLKDVRLENTMENMTINNNINNNINTNNNNQNNNNNNKLSSINFITISFKLNLSI
jgi:hypothetical protein